MWLVGQVIDVRPGFEGERKAETPDWTTLYIKAGGDVTAVVCYTPYVPEDIIDRYVRIAVRLREIRVPSDRRGRLEELYQAQAWTACIEILGRRVVRTLRFKEEAG